MQARALVDGVRTFVRSATSRANLPASGLWVSFLAVLGIITLRVQTYVSGQDPNAYMQIVQELVYRPDGWKAALSACLKYGPGWTGFLAVTRVLFGSLAPYWVAPLAFIGLMLLLYRFMKRIVIEPEKAFLCTTATAAVMLTGFFMSPYYLLYPFRGTFCYFLVFLAYALCGSLADRPPKRSRILFSAIAIAYAILVREPMVFAAAALFVFILSTRVPWRWKTLFVFCLPFLIPLIAFAGSALITGAFGTEQLELWWTYLVQRYEKGMGDTVRFVCIGQFKYIHQALGWTGLFCLTLACERFWRNRNFLCLLVLPAVALFGFYALYDVAHQRYVLSILIFLVPAAVCGLIALLDLLLKRGVFARVNPRLVYYGLSLAFIVQLAMAGAGMAPLWGVNADARDIHNFRKVLKSRLRPDDALCTEWYFSYLSEAVAGHTRYTSLQHPDEVLEHVSKGRRCFFLKPLDEKAAVHKPKRFFQVPVETLLNHTCDLQPVKEASGAVRTISFEGFPYQVMEVKAWTKSDVSQIVRPKPDDAPVLWLNLRAPGGWKKIDLMRDGEVLQHHESDELSGYVAVILSASVGMEPFTVRVQSEHPLPPRPVVGLQRHERFVLFDLGPGRDLSSEKWFYTPFTPGPSETRQFAFNHYDHASRSELAQGAVDLPKIWMPVIFGEPAALDVSLSFNWFRRAPGTVNMAYRSDIASIGAYPFDLNSRENRHFLPIPLGGDAPSWLTFQVEADEALRKHIRFSRIGFRVHH
ncbi:MAG: hypothetical protein ACI9TH_000982 [Kiritimatiellia bacterium]|jgi:hypothetical protein